MMSATSNDYTVSFDAAWRVLPTADEDAASVIHDLVEALNVEDPAADGLRRGLEAVTALSRELAPGQRNSWALVRDPSSGAVDALLSTRVSLVGPSAIDDYRARIADGQHGDPEIRVVNRTVSERELAVGTALIVHDFTLHEDAEGLIDPALERAVVALFLSGTNKLVEFYLVTQNLALFDDIAEYLVSIVSGHGADIDQEQL
ncbi:MAG: hypothetical protein ABJA94_04305 [Rhodoglobus sp.]